MGGADHRMHTGVQPFKPYLVVEFPPQIPVSDAEKFHVKRGCFTVRRLSFCPVSPTLKVLRENRYHWIRATPLFSANQDTAVYVFCLKRDGNPLCWMRRKFLIRRSIYTIYSVRVSYIIAGCGKTTITRSMPRPLFLEKNIAVGFLLGKAF